MSFRNRIAFVIALIVLTGICLSAPTWGRTVASTKIQVGGRNERNQQNPISPAPNGERKLRVIPIQQMPVKVKEVRNLNSPTWYKDLEIEVQNISDKSIYSILAVVFFPDDYSNPSINAVFSLRFGLAKYLKIRVVGDPSDPHLKPGETCVLKLGKWYWDGFRQREQRYPERFRSFAMTFNVISFGDATGFTAEDGWQLKTEKP